MKARGDGPKVVYVSSRRVALRRMVGIYVGIAHAIRVTNAMPAPRRILQVRVVAVDVVAEHPISPCCAFRRDPLPVASRRLEGVYYRLSAGAVSVAPSLMSSHPIFVSA